MLNTKISNPIQHHDWREQLTVRVAWYYYVLGLTQKEIALKVGINRVRVIRLLADARRRGVVTITINSELTENVELGEQLCERYGIEFSEVVLSHSDDENRLSEIVGMAACRVVLHKLKKGMTIGLGWGVTLKALAEAMPETSTQDISIVSMLGSLTQRSSVNKFEATALLATKLNAEGFYLPGPIVCDTEKARNILFSQPFLKGIYNRARNSDLALVSIGGLNSATIRQVGLISEDDFQSVLKAGAIGNFLGYYIDKNAKIINHPVNRRIIGLRLEEFILIKERIMISAGPNKVDVLRAVLEQGMITGLVTDQVTARSLLEPPPQK